MKVKRAFARSFLLLSCLFSGSIASAQFNSGSTGTDGALNLTNANCPGNVCYVQLPETGVLHFTTIQVPEGKTLRFVRNSRNTPVVILAQGLVRIAGEINLDAQSDATGRSIPGPGGFFGGQQGMRGLGPGGGPVEYPSNATWTGPLSLVPNVGGSGGGGACANGGGAGGGAITIASSTSIEIPSTGSVLAQGSLAAACGTGGGAGGGIRLVSNAITAAGNFRACNIYSWTPPFCAIVRIEASERNFTGTSVPAAVLSSINPTVPANNLPNLSIISVGGRAVPSYAGSRFDTVDLLLDNALVDPIPVAVQAVNIPSGTQVNVGFVSGSHNATSTPCTLSGGPGPLSCTATISNLNRSGVTYLLATAAFDPPASLAKHNPPGAAHVARVRMEATLGGPTKYVFLDKGGKMIEEARIAPDFLRYFGK